jgi:thiol-disulfide isomerase/thioredoxin
VKDTAFIVIATTILLFVSMANVQVTGSPQIGKGDFTLPIVDRDGLTGKTLTLSGFLGNVIVLEFMGAWCPPCQQLTPTLESLYKQFAAEGVVFVAVAEPWNAEWNAHYQNVTIEQFLSEYNSSLTYVLDSSDWQVGTMYGVPSVPTLFVLYKNGTVESTYNGAGVIEDNSAGAIRTAQVTPIPEFSDSAAIIATFSIACLVLLCKRLIQPHQ